jgi:ABC-type transporter Mla MlaB component
LKRKVILTGAVTIYEVVALRSQFETWIAELPKGRRGAALNESPLVVEAHGVDEVDAAGMQLLVSLSRSLAARRRPLQLVNPSSPLVAACEALGVAALLLAYGINGTNA